MLNGMVTSTDTIPGTGFTFNDLDDLVKPLPDGRGAILHLWGGAIETDQCLAVSIVHHFGTYEEWLANSYEMWLATVPVTGSESGQVRLHTDGPPRDGVVPVSAEQAADLVNAVVEGEALGQLYKVLLVFKAESEVNNHDSAVTSARTRLASAERQLKVAQHTVAAAEVELSPFGRQLVEVGRAQRS